MGLEVNPELASIDWNKANKNLNYLQVYCK